MFERFTDRARQGVHRAVDASERMGSRHVGTEHLLLGMLAGDGGVAYTVLDNAGVRADEVRVQIERFMGQDSEALEAIGIDLEAVRAKIEETFGPGALDDLERPPKRGWLRRRRLSGGHRPFTPRAEKVLELSLREALALKHNYIGTEHLLLGLLREGNGLAAKILADAGLDFAELREQTIAASRAAQ
jgi:ATP-dependent Clp protease ATP-binding subunit ClpA